MPGVIVCTYGLPVSLLLNFKHSLCVLEILSGLPITGFAIGPAADDAEHAWRRRLKTEVRLVVLVVFEIFLAKKIAQLNVLVVCVADKLFGFVDSSGKDSGAPRADTREEISVGSLPVIYLGVLKAKLAVVYFAEGLVAEETRENIFQSLNKFVRWDLFEEALPVLGKVGAPAMISPIYNFTALESTLGTYRISA